MLRNKNFRGPNRFIYDIKYLDNNKHFEKHLKIKIV